MAVDIKNKATRINLLDFSSPPMRTFHVTWFAFFSCFFGWFGIAPLMAIVRDDLQLTKTQIGNTIIASVAITIIVRLLIGPLSHRFGPRKTYTGLLILGSIPVMGIGLANSYESFLLFRLAIGAIGASFVITQYHTALMFAPNCVGTANATTAGWGNLGGGVTQMAMPIVLAIVMMFVAEQSLGWRIAMVIPGIVLFTVGIAYWFLTQDTPNGNFDELRARGELEAATGENSATASFLAAIKDYRVWILFITYATCFGVELTINNIAALYFHDQFQLGVATAGLIASLFGLMNIFARTLGGIFSDIFARRHGFMGRIQFFFAVLLLEGIALIIFSQMNSLIFAILTLITFSLFVQMSEGASFGIVPFVNKKALGAVAGIVGAGGNFGAVMAGFLFRSEALTTQEALFYLGMAVVVSSFFILAIRFSPEKVQEENEALHQALAEREAKVGTLKPALAEA
jgi:NNP family nitrate/nitrite transporter-like MFS transporter